MENLPKHGFYKIIMGDFITKLRIPPFFVAKHREFLSEKVTLQTDHQPGKSWIVKIEETNGGYWLTHGWENFMKDNSLNFGNFLVFDFIKDSRIRVRIFDKNGCERDASTPTSEPEIPSKVIRRQPVTTSSSSAEGSEKTSPSFHEESDRENHDQSHEDVVLVDGFHANKNISFTFTWKKRTRNCMTIKGSICKKIGLAKAESAKLRNLEGHVHEVRLNPTADGRVSLGVGWAAFVDASNFVVDQTYKFEFIPSCKDQLLLQLSLIKRKSS